MSDSTPDEKSPLLDHSVTIEDEAAPLLSATAGVDQTAAELEAQKKAEEARRSRMLLFSFLIMVVVGLGNKIFQKLQTLPMHDYPYFLSLLTTFIYVPASFAYIYPMIWFGSQITPEQRAIPKYKFAIMGLLDGIAGVMQVFATNAITNGGLLILLQQSAIPISMVITKYMLKAKYKPWNYLGAFIVVIGLAVVLIPSFMTKDDSEPKLFLVWVGVMLLSCVPMTLSSVYKEKALGETEIDVVYLNGWVALFQFFVTAVFAVPCGYANDPAIPPKQLPTYLYNGFMCYIGKTLDRQTSIDDKGFGKGQHSNLGWCGGHAGAPLTAPVSVNIYMFFNLLYNVFIILILKYGGSNILWLAMTIMVPLGNVAFALKFVPGHKDMRVTDIVGLVVIMGGLVMYRFWEPVTRLMSRPTREWLAAHNFGPAVPADDEEDDQFDRTGSIKYPLLGSQFASVEIADPIFVVRPERKLIRSQHQIRSNYFARLGIAPGGLPGPGPSPADNKYKTIN